MKDILKAVTVLVIGGTIYTVSQADIIQNFAKDTGLSQQEAKEYVENISEDDMVPFDEIGTEFISDGQDIINSADEIDCENFTYEWESSSMTCSTGKSQLKRIGNSEIALGKSYKILDTEKATEADISLVITNIDRLNVDLKLEIVKEMLEKSVIDEITKSNSYNKALLQAALDSK